MTSQQLKLGARLASAGALAAALFAGAPANAHEDPGGCFETGPAIIVTAFRANGTTGVTGVISECETINYRATLTKANNSGTICAFGGGVFSLTTPDGVLHTIETNTPCIGGTALEGCDANVTQIQSVLFPYTVRIQDIVNGNVVASASYSGGITHDSPDNTAGVNATTPRSLPVVLCDDNNLCTIDDCDDAAQGADACSNTPIVCDDNNVCTADTCIPATGCSFGAPLVCDDNNACTDEECDPVLGCQTTDTVVCDDNNACTEEACNPETGQCGQTSETDCDDNNLCTTDACIPATGLCSNVDNVTPTCEDNDACTEEDCNPATGQCRTTDTTVCNDNDVCTDDSCNPETGQCEFVFDPENDESCRNDAICRTPGFWKTHGSVSQQVINAGGGCLEVCGEVITTATASSVGNANSVLEAMCIQPRGEHRLQLVRQLTALALNCVISEFGPDCGGDTALGELFADCNEACLENDGVGDCIAAIDCFNNGGVFNSTTGLCGDAEGESCHDRALPETIDQGPADTPQACNAAAKNSCTVILSGEASCTSGNKTTPAAESCP